LCVVLFNEIMRTRVPSIGAAVAFFLLLSLVPLLMVASAMLGVLPIPNLFQQLLDMMAMLVPPDAMVFVKSMLQSIVTPHAGRILSIGVLSYLWASAGAFVALIDALNIAYDVKEGRSWWRDRVQALLLTFTSGGLALISLLCLIAGPHFAHVLSYLVPIPAVFTVLWPPLRVGVMLVTFISGLVLLYYFGPNKRTTLRSSLPGAALAVGIWFVGSLILSYYLEHMANYSATYGSLGAIIGLMLWLYLTSVSILVGAELNAELIKRTGPQQSDASTARPGAAVPAAGVLQRHPM
ncbi:MAG TPA: YihY/virulence factor BrkB family protein, partial [Acidobacteriaceae bacterium]